MVIRSIGIFHSPSEITPPRREVDHRRAVIATKCFHDEVPRCRIDLSEEIARYITSFADSRAPLNAKATKKLQILSVNHFYIKKLSVAILLKEGKKIDQSAIIMHYSDSYVPSE